MPFVTIDTNVKVNVTDTMLEEVTDIIVKTLHKPENAVTVKINTGVVMAFGGSRKTPGALIEVKSIGYSDKKEVLAQQFLDFAQTYFNAEGQFVGIHFVDMKANDVSHNGVLMG